MIPVFRNMLAAVSRAAGYKVRVAHNAQEERAGSSALGARNRRHPDPNIESPKDE